MLIYNTVVIIIAPQWGRTTDDGNENYGERVKEKSFEFEGIAWGP